MINNRIQSNKHLIVRPGNAGMAAVYLIVAESGCARKIGEVLKGSAVEPVHSCVWVLPWAGSADDLLSLLHSSVPQAHLVVSEVTGQWACL